MIEWKKQKLLIVLGIILLVTLGIKLWQLRWPSAVIELKGQELKVLVAEISHHQRKGLGGRESLEEYDGMVFLFSYSDKHTMVMRNMEFPIDIVWLEKGVVVDIAPNIQAEPSVPEANLTKYYPRKSANLVIELPTGWVEKNDLRIGDKMVVIGPDD